MTRNCVNSPDNVAIFAEKLLFHHEKSINTDGEKKKKFLNAISVTKSETKTKNGLLMYVVSLVLQFYVNG